MSLESGVSVDGLVIVSVFMVEAVAISVDSYLPLSGQAGPRSRTYIYSPTRLLWMVDSSILYNSSSFLGFFWLKGSEMKRKGEVS